MRCPEGWERPGCTGAGLAEVPVRGQDSVRLGLWIRHGELPMRGVVGGDCRQKLGGGWGEGAGRPTAPPKRAWVFQPWTRRPRGQSHVHMRAFASKKVACEPTVKGGAVSLGRVCPSQAPGPVNMALLETGSLQVCRSSDEVIRVGLNQHAWYPHEESFRRRHTGLSPHGDEQGVVPPRGPQRLERQEGPGVLPAP